MKHLTFRIAHVALQFGQQRDGSGRGHILKHVFRPILTHHTLLDGNVGGKVGSDDFPLLLIFHHAQDTFTIVDDCFIQLLTFSGAGSQHHLRGSFQVFTVTDVVYVTVFAVALLDNLYLEVFGKVIDAVAHRLHEMRLVIPNLHLLRIRLHLSLELIQYRLVRTRCVGRRTVQSLAHQREAVQHVTRHIECEHSHQDHIHKIDHLLAGRNSFLLYRHL